VGDYWLKQDDGTVLGPLGIQVVRDLVRTGQLRAVREVSTSGRNWQPLGAFPELAAALAAPAQIRSPGSEAADIRAEAAAARRKLPHELFGVRPGASLNDFRAAFFERIKRYHPHRLHPGTAPDVRAACAEMYKVLSDAMMAIQSSGAAPSTPPVGSPPARPTPPPAFRPDEFVGLEQKGTDRVEARVLVGAHTAPLFTAHKLVNVSTGGFFIAGRTYPLGMAFDVTLRFEGSPQTMSTRGKVVLESAGTDPRQPRGTGVQLNLSSSERSFLQSFIGDVVAKQQNKAR
jgi:hypothetical protein